MSNFVKVAEAAALKQEKPLCVKFEGKEIAVVLHEGRCFAFDRECRHKGTPLDHGAVTDGKIYCPLHGWGFDLQSGDCDTNPEKPLRTYPARIENGEVRVQFA